MKHSIALGCELQLKANMLLPIFPGSEAEDGFLFLKCSQCHMFKRYEYHHIIICPKIAVPSPLQSIQSHFLLGSPYTTTLMVNGTDI